MPAVSWQLLCLLACFAVYAYCLMLQLEADLLSHFGELLYFLLYGESIEEDQTSRTLEDLPAEVCTIIRACCNARRTAEFFVRTSSPTDDIDSGHTLGEACSGAALPTVHEQASCEDQYFHRKRVEAAKQSQSQKEVTQILQVWRDIACFSQPTDTFNNFLHLSVLLLSVGFPCQHHESEWSNLQWGLQQTE